MALIEISRNVANEAHAILIVDQAGWHMSATLEQFRLFDSRVHAISPTELGCA